METRFQTSFIPKKPMPAIGGGMPSAPQHRRGTGSIFMIIAVVLFVCSLLSVGAAYGWKQYLLSDQVTLKSELAAREQQFNVDLIEQLKTSSVKISLVQNLLAQHLAVSKLFGIISALTAQSIRFTSLDVVAPKSPGGDLAVSLSGYGQNLSAVAFQSDVLGKLDQYGLRKIVKNPILSNPSLDAAGTVSFSLTASVDPSSLSYESSLQPAAPAASSTPSP
ncbi:MAG: hypothetical protein KGI69_00765 [Patescibacteria group bacterium]|nr:hypothetical protein [Patescibacteria group bacterium]